MAQLTGLFRIGNDPQVRFTPKGDAVVNLSLAYSYGTKSTDGKRPTQWVEAAIWGKLAEALQQYLVKGGQVFAAISDLHIETYQGKNGEGHKLAGRINEIELVGSRKDADQSSQQGQQQSSQYSQPPSRAPQSNSGGAFANFDDDIPF